MSLANLFYLKETFRENVRRWRQACFRHCARAGHEPRFTLEALEPRVLLSATPTEVPSPIEPTTTDATITPALAGPSLDLPNLDVNLDGQTTPQDAIVILRYLSLVTGPALTAGLVTGGDRTDPTAIKTYLDQVRTTLLDVNLDGQTTPQDAIVILRYLSLVSGPALTAGVVTGGTRTDPAAIASALDNMNPQRELVAPLVTAGLQQDTGLSATDSDQLTGSSGMTGSS